MLKNLSVSMFTFPVNKECGLTTLETRMLKGDQVEVFKIMNGYENIYRNMFFSIKKDSRIRGHEVKISKGSV